MPEFTGPEAAADAVWHALKAAVSSTLDGHVTIALSAGIDSTAIATAAVAAELDVAAVTWSFVDTPEADESRWAARTASHLGLALVDVEIDAAAMIPEEGVVTLPFSPLANIFQGAWDRTAQVATGMGRPGIATGVGGEQLFMISSSPAADLLGRGRPVDAVRCVRRNRRSSWPMALRRDLVGPLLRPMLRRRFARRLELPAWLAERHVASWRRLQTVTERIADLTNGMIEWTTQHDEYMFAPLGARAVEPLLTPDLIEVALRVPPWMLIGGGRDKRILRDALLGRIPDDVVELPKFDPSPAARTAIRARRDALLSLTRSMRLSDAGYVDERRLQEYVLEFMDGQHHNMDFWNTLTLEDWLRRWH